MAADVLRQFCTSTGTRCIYEQQRVLLKFFCIFEVISVHCTFVCVQLKELSHVNIVSFIGACVEPEHLCYLMHNCSRGTLQVGQLLGGTNTTNVATVFYRVTLC